MTRGTSNSSGVVLAAVDPAAARAAGTVAGARALAADRGRGLVVAHVWHAPAELMIAQHLSAELARAYVEAEQRRARARLEACVAAAGATDVPRWCVRGRAASAAVIAEVILACARATCAACVVVGRSGSIAARIAGEVEVVAVRPAPLPRAIVHRRAA